MTDLEREALRKKRGLSELSQKQKQILSDYLQNSPYKRIDKDLENEGGFYGAKADDFGAMLEGRGKFRGSDRYASNLGESLDSVFGAPARTSIDRLQEGNIKAALVDAMAQVGRDPEEAPTGVDIASKVTDNPYLGAGLATAVDLGAQVPMPFSPGVVGKVKSIVPEAEAILSKIKTPEQAVALKGAEREQYLKALDEVYGDRAKRAKDMGFGDKTWYHGSTVDIPAFKNDAKGLSTGAQSAKRGFFFADDPSTASDYADLAREKGVIREGDKVTTKWMSDSYEEPDQLKYWDVDRAKDAWREANERTDDYLAKKKAELAKNLADWDKNKSMPEDSAFYHARKRDDGSLTPLAEWIDAKKEAISKRYNQFYGSLKPATPQEISEKEKAFFEAYKQYFNTSPEVAEKTHSIYLDTKNLKEREILQRAAEAGRDLERSTGQNVLPVKLRPQEGKKIRAKNYGGTGYRDESYADIMQKAMDEGQGGVLFKNTYDPADPNNRVLQNIAAVFEPNQIRSVNAAFDPRFKDSDLLLAGKAGVNPADLPSPLISAIRQKREEKNRNK